MNNTIDTSMHNEIATKLTQSKDTYANDAIELREHAL
jgi:hypothetical protein